MIRCKLINFLFSVFLLRAFQGFLIKNHFEKCPDCRESLAAQEEARALFVHEDRAVEWVSLWPGISTRLCQDEAKKIRLSFWPRWRWALGAAGLAGFLFVGFFWLTRSPETVEIALRSGTDEHFQINYIKVEEKSAGAYVYESQDSGMIIVWAERTP